MDPAAPCFKYNTKFAFPVALNSAVDTVYTVDSVYTVDTVTISILTHVPFSDSTATIAPTLTVLKVYATAVSTLLCRY